MIPAVFTPATTSWYRVRREHHHRRTEHPLLWAVGWLATIASGLGSFVILKRAEDHGSLLPAIFSLLGGIMALSALHVLGSGLSVETGRLLLPLPLTPASCWRLMMIDALLVTGKPALTILIAATMATSWQWVLVLACWIPVACTMGTAIACAFSWIHSGVRIRWRALIVLAGAILAAGASLWMLVTAPRQLPPLMLLPDAFIFIGLSLGPGASFVGRVVQPILRQVATTPPATFALVPRLTTQLAGILERQTHPGFAIARKDLLTHSRDAFILIRVAMIVGVLPLAILLKPHFGASIPSAAWIPALVIILTCYGMVELSPSPFGSEGNRLLLALQTDIASSSLLFGKVLGMLLFNLPQTWAAVTIVSIGTGAGLPTWMFAIASASIAVTGLCTILTCASSSDIDLDRRIDDRTSALLAEHMPIGACRMLGLGLTGAIAISSIAILIRTPPTMALPLLCLLHAGCAALAWRIGLRILDKHRSQA